MKKTIRSFSVRAAMMLLTTILFAMTAQPAWATQTTVSLSGNATDGYYINMPAKGAAKTFDDAYVLTLDGSIKTFKLYDDGGKSGNHSVEYKGYLVINVPSDYYIQITGSLQQVDPTTLTVFENNTGDNSVDSRLIYQQGNASIDKISTSSAITVLHETTAHSNEYSRSGFDFTMTLVKKGAYDDLYAEVSSDGTAMTLKCAATGTASTDASAGRYKFLHNYNSWPSGFDAYKSAITTVNVDASCANFTGLNLNELFTRFTALTTIYGLSNLRTANVKRMRYMFYNCSKLTMIDLGTWDTSSVEEGAMSTMFNECRSLTTIVIGPNWTPANNSKYMFHYCYSLVGDAGTQWTEGCNSTTADYGYAHAGEGGFMTADWTGSGTADDPYVIGSKAHLDLLALRVNGGNTYEGKYFKLGADITYDGTENNFTPIGTNGKPFMGTFDGNGKTISGLNINLPETDYVGLFGNVNSATIKGVKLDDSTITGKQCVGGIVSFGGNSETTVENCAVTSTVTVSATSIDVGGIVGLYATVRGCSSAAAVSGSQYVGGIIGFGNGSSVEHSLYTGSSVTATINRSGAIIGNKGNASLTANYYTQATVGGCNGSDEDGARRAYAVTLGTGVSMGETGTAYGTVTNNGDVAITPFANNPGLIYTTKSGGTVTNTTYVGATETVTLSYSGTVDEGYAVGYKVNDGEATVGNTITMPDANATITESSIDVWGMAGGADGTSEATAYTITTPAGLDLLAQKVNAGNEYRGKYFKLGDNVTYDGTENNFTPIGTQSHPFRGTFDGNGKTISGLNINLPETDYVGLFGNVNSATIKGVKLDDSTITGKQCVGGIVSFGGNSETTVENCAVTSTVTVSATSIDVGGIVGLYATVRGCSSAAAVSGSQYVGGIIGFGNGSSVEHSLYTGSSVTATINRSGAIIGNKGNASLTANYYTQATVGGCNGADTNGARKAVAIGKADGVTITPTGETTTYNVSGITAYAGNTILGFAGTLYAGATETVKLNISYTVDGYAVSGYTDGNGTALTANDDGTYTLNMTDAAPTITATTADVWGIAAGADGTSEETAYTITTTAGLDLLAQKVNAGNYYNGKYFKLGADIDYPHLADDADGAETENNYTAIGKYGRSFDGHFDGKGYTISGIRIYKGGDDYSTDYYQGLFGCIGYYAEVKNVTLADTRITANNVAGGIAGSNGSGTIANCHVTNTVKILANNESVNDHGGIVGYSSGTVRGCISEATLTKVSGGIHYGGIVGYTSGTLENNFAIGATIPAAADGKSHGAIVGDNINGTLKNNYYTACTVAGVENATNVGVGIDKDYNIVGDVVENDGALYDVWDVTKGADGSEAKPYTITTTAGLDLLAQKVNAGNYYNGKYFKLGGDITYTHLADGADGADTENNFTSIGNYYKSFDGHFDGNGKTISGIRIYKGGNDYSTDGFQGLFGRILLGAEVKNVTLTDTRITAANETGGIVGDGGGTIADCHVTNTVKILAINENVDRHGGIVGYNSGGTVSGCISEATFTNVSGWAYGGIAGFNDGKLENNLVIGATIPAAEYNSHGAIAGQNNNGTLTNNYYTACTVADVENATNVGVGIDSNFEPVGDVAENNGALIVHKITLAEGVTDVTIGAGAKVYTFDSKNYYVAGTTVKLTYTGTPATGYVFNGITVGEGVTVTPSGNDYTITMPAKDVTVSTSFKKLLTNTDITVATIADQTCTGSEIEPAITVKDGTTDITGECTITYSDNTAVGTATVTITAKATSNAYAGEIATTFTIVREMSGLFADGNQWTGYVAQENLTLPDGLTAYAVTALGETTATAAALGYIPQGEPVLLCRSDKTSNLYRARAGSGTVPATNLLQAASSTNQPRAYQDYVLYQDAFILTSGGTLATGKVFLPIPSANASRAVARSIVLDDGETTGMEDVRWQTEEGSGDWYSIDGRKLDGKPTRKGVYIMNGKKVIIK